MALTRTQRAVALPTAIHDKSREAAERDGVSQAAWVAEAVQQRWARDGARAYAAYMSQPEMAEQLTQWRPATPAWPGDGEQAAA